MVDSSNSIFPVLPKEGLESAGSAIGRLRLRTFLITRWITIIGQTAALLFVHFILGAETPLALGLLIISIPAWLNIALSIFLPVQKLVRPIEAVLHFTFDIVQITVLMAITGGLSNPFLLMMLGPVTIASTSLNERLAMGLAAFAIACTSLLWVFHLPMPLPEGVNWEAPFVFQLGQYGAISTGLCFFAFSAFRVTRDEARLVRALDAAHAVIAREQRISALGALAAATAHELGSPLATIHLVAREMDADVENGSPQKEDIKLIVEQAERCRAILHQLSEEKEADDLIHAQISLLALLEEAASPYQGVDILIHIRTFEHVLPTTGEHPVLRRSPEILHGLSVLIENAVSFAQTEVFVDARWTEMDITITITDDGPGFSPAILPRLGEPYQSERDKEHAKGGGMGLGFFIAKTLIEQSGGDIAAYNQPEPDHGAVVRLRWDRLALSAENAW